MYDLLPCPYCGQRPRPLLSLSAGQWSIYHSCDRCLIAAYGKTEAEAVEDWNDRALTFRLSDEEAWHD